jgi:hypothetical protein
MPAIGIRTDGQKVYATSPFHPDMRAGAKRLNGRWLDPAWVFDARDEERVRDLLRSIYGTDGTPCQTVDVRLDVKKWYDYDAAGDDRTIYFAGREIAYRPARDSAVRIGDGVVLVEGSFTPTGGSVKYPSIGVSYVDTIVVEVRDIPATHPHVVGSTEAEQGVTVLTTAVDVEALRAERAALTARLAEIDAQLGEVWPSTKV